MEGKVLRVDNTLDKRQQLGDEVDGIVSDGDAVDVELDFVLHLLGLEEAKGSALGNKEDGAESKLTFKGRKYQTARCHWSTYDRHRGVSSQAHSFYICAWRVAYHSLFMT